MVSSGKHKLIILLLLLGIFLAIPTLYFLANHKFKRNGSVKVSNWIDAFSIKNDGNYLVIDKETKELTIFKNYKEVDVYPVTIGKKPGNKIFSGDNRTPEGIFLVKSIENSSHWVYDYKNDTLDPIRGAYGPWFVRLSVPGFNGIGIHGFYHDEDLGERASHGCIRLNNDDLENLVEFVKPGMPVVIIPDKSDLEVNEKLLSTKTNRKKSMSRVSE